MHLESLAHFLGALAEAVHVCNYGGQVPHAHVLDSFLELVHAALEFEFFCVHFRAVCSERAVNVKIQLVNGVLKRLGHSLLDQVLNLGFVVTIDLQELLADRSLMCFQFDEEGILGFQLNLKSFNQVINFDQVIRHTANLSNLLSNDHMRRLLKF
jgi:hypothetical protein